MKMKYISLFAGVEGFGLAAHWLRWKGVLAVEWDIYCQKVIRARFPKIKINGDIKRTGFTAYRQVGGVVKVMTLATSTDSKAHGWSTYCGPLTWEELMQNPKNIEL